MSDLSKPLLTFAGYHLRAKPLCDGCIKMERFELDEPQTNAGLDRTV